MEAATPVRHGSSDTRILVVDDEPVNIRLLERYLRSEGYRVRSAANGLEALGLVNQEAPDLMIVDIAMPLLDGLSLCQRLRENVLTRALPIIFITAQASLESRLKGFQAGADDYLLKPFDLDELKVRIEGTLQRRRWSLMIHPLTQLPGSPAIEEEVWKRLLAGLPFAFAYIDIDNFKAYNDVYGYERGDRVIKDVGTLLIEAALSVQGESALPGHVGGDDFVLISSVSHMKEALERMTACFDDMRLKHYSAEDRLKGCITTKNRQGVEQKFPLMTLSAAVISTETRHITHYARLIELASELKGYLKKQDHQGKSLSLWDRRNDMPPKDE